MQSIPVSYPKRNPPIPATPVSPSTYRFLKKFMSLLPAVSSSPELPGMVDKSIVMLALTDSPPKIQPLAQRAPKQESAPRRSLKRSQSLSARTQAWTPKSQLEAARTRRGRAREFQKQGEISGTGREPEKFLRQLSEQRPAFEDRASQRATT